MEKERFEYLDISEAIRFIEKDPLREVGKVRRFLVTGEIRVWPANYSWLGNYGKSPKIENISFHVKHDKKLAEGLYRVSGELSEMVFGGGHDVILKIHTVQKV